MLNIRSLQKMKVPAGTKILITGNESDSIQPKDPDPEGYFIEFEISPGKKYATALVFATEREKLKGDLERIIPVLENEARLWICFPKKNSGIPTDLTRESVWDAGKDFQQRPVSQIALDGAWTAIRLRPESEVRSRSGVAIPGVDLEKRTVTPPADLAEALEGAGLKAAFDRLSFTHRKEHVEAIVTAKKPETRAGRIHKCLQMLKK